MTNPFSGKRIFYDYGQKVTYDGRNYVPHLGVDYGTYFENLPAPVDCKILRVFTAKAGGLTLWFQPLTDNTIHRWLHNDKIYVKEGQTIEEGMFMARSGNSGLVFPKPTPQNPKAGAHTHYDIWKSNVTLNFFDTINPHTYWAEKHNFGYMLRNYKGTIYALIAGYWVGIATSYDEFLQDFGQIDVPEMNKSQFEAFPLNRRTIN